MTKVNAMIESEYQLKSKKNPRELMRARHPDLFSDTSIETSPRLPKAVFEYHLDTLTNRKQEYEFEHFCRKLAEKEICPNLRVQTGPTGGGDSKVDSETYPVAPEVAERWWIGETSAGSERWAFAFSAKKTWMPKLRADVENIVSTGRDYKRIYFFTNQFVSDRNRSKLEDELFESYGIPLHIIDRSWIVEKVYEHGHLDIAIVTLAINGVSEDKKGRSGPLDFVRLAELQELEQQISDSSRYHNARFQLVEDCLRCAILARGLERPRHEVEGRFSQAERLAQELGISQQLMRIAYNRAWTAHWWYEDYSAFVQFYKKVEEYLANSSEAEDLGRLLNLWYLLVTIESQGLVEKELVEIDIHREKISALLGTVAKDSARPNNALHAKTSLAFMCAMDAIRTGDVSNLGDVWIELTQIVDDSSVLGQYPLESLADMVRELGNFADSVVFDSLYERVTEAMRQRRSDGEAGNAYRERGIQKLQNDRPYEAIRWIGRAEELLVKEEYQDDLVMTLVAGSLAFERAGLLWAARNKILVATERSLRAFAISGQMATVTLRIIQRMTWIELQLGRIPHVLQAMAWAGFVAKHLKLSDERQAEYDAEVQMQDAVLGIHLLNLPIEGLHAAEKLPDGLAREGLTSARMSLLFALGHEKRIFSENYFPADMNKDEVQSFFEQWQDQPATNDIPKFPTLIEGKTTQFRSVILGSEFVIAVPSNPTSIGVAESLLGALEALLATSDETDLIPHVERTTITIKTSDSVDSTPTFVFSGSVDGDAVIMCPAQIVFSTTEDIHKFSDWLSKTVFEIAARQFLIRDPETWFKRIAGDERAFSRAILLGDMLTIGRNTFGHEPSVRLSDWIEPDDKIYECLRTELWRQTLPSQPDSLKSTDTRKFGVGSAPPNLLDNSNRKHTDRQVISPIDMSLWNQARWCGTLFAMAEQPPPILGLMFEDAQAGKSIFTSWKAKWGQGDLQDALRILIVTGISKKHPAHYAISVGPNFDHSINSETKVFVSVSRINRMTPVTSKNLELFLTNFRQSGVYLLVPASIDMDKCPKIEMDFSLGKSHLHVRQAWEIGENDPDAMVLADDDEPIIPDGIMDPPVIKALEKIRALRQRGSK